MASGARRGQVQLPTAQRVSSTSRAYESSEPSANLSVFDLAANLGSLSSWTRSTFAATVGVSLRFVE
jgi:hypothetical protein